MAKKKSTKKNQGSGCLLWLFIFLLLGILGSCFGGGETDTTTATTPSASTELVETTASVESLDEETTVTVAETETQALETAPTVEETTEATVHSTEAIIETTQAAKTQTYEYTYVLNTNSRKFHYSSCSSANKIKASNKSTFTGTRDELIAKGYEPCGRCHP